MKNKGVWLGKWQRIKTKAKKHWLIIALIFIIAVLISVIILLIKQGLRPPIIFDAVAFLNEVKSIIVSMGKDWWVVIFTAATFFLVLIRDLIIASIHKNNLEIKIIYYSSTKNEVTKENNHYFFMTFTNDSRSPICIAQVAVKYNGESYYSRYPERNVIGVEEKATKNSSFPLQLNALGADCGIFVITIGINDDELEVLPDVISLKVISSRGEKSFNILPEKKVEWEDFRMQFRP